jgi:hypothetical protein
MTKPPVADRDPGVIAASFSLRATEQFPGDAAKRPARYKTTDSYEQWTSRNNFTRIDRKRKADATNSRFSANALIIPGVEMSEPEYLESLLAPLRAAFHAKRRDRVDIAEQISRGLAAYIKAVDVAVTRELCKAHGLAAPAAGEPPERLAAELLRLVRMLPELRAALAVESSGGRSAVTPENPADALSEGASESAAVARADKRQRAGSAAPELSTAAEARLAHLVSAMAKAPLVIVGGPPHLERLTVLPAGCRTNVEWIDTTKQGTHAIGNLERRIRDHRILAIIILEGLVQHRHSDPLISAARGVALAHAFGGKGGRAALGQALGEIESRLSRHLDTGSPKR